jgi:dipeptidyl aminopeptidase/acylaminoacyl peptidase/threonine/homoserine/homoserine lactone efflux protein
MMMTRVDYLTSMTLKTWLLFLAMETALSLSPGPAVFYVVSQGARGALRRTLPAAAGILSANGIYFALSATSLGAIIAASARFFTIAKWAGAAYLVYLGIRALRSANSTHAVVFGGTPTAQGNGLRAIYLGALTLQLANPKALLFFLALLPQFIDPGIPVVPQMLILAATSMLPELCILTAYGWLAHRAVHASVRFGVTGNMNRWLARIEGAGLLGCATLVSMTKGGDMRLIVALALCLGIGRIATAETAPAERLVHRYHSVEISPDGKFVASVEGDSPRSGGAPTIRALVIRRARTGSAVTVAMPCGSVPQCWPESTTWAPDGKRLSFVLRTPGTHARAVYAVAPDASGLTKLLDFSGTIVDLRYTPDGRLAMLATQNATKEVGATQAGAPIAGDLDTAPPEQRLAILEKGVLHWISPPDLYVYEYDWRSAGKGFVATAAPGDGDNNWWTAKLYTFSDNDSAGHVIYTPVDDRQQLAIPKVSPDGSMVAFIAGIMSDFGSTGGDVYTLSLDGGAATNITPAMRASATALTWRCDGHLLAELLTGDKTQLVDLGSGHQPGLAHVLWSGAESFGDRSDGISAACPSGMTAHSHESFTQPPEIETGAMGQWRNLTSINAGMSVSLRAQSIWWKNDGFDVQGWLLLPVHAAASMPMIVSVHGGPAAAVTPRFDGPGISSALLEHGYALFRPNPRGSFGQGERFAMANVRDFGHGDLRDILAGVDAAAKVAPIDQARLGITGGSYGGFMTMWAVTQTDRFKGAVAAAGISNWLSYYGENGIDAWLIPYFGASAYDDPAVYAQSSPINYMHNVKTPTFAYVGEYDIECPAPQTQEFWHAMKAINVPTAIMIYPGEGHGLRDPEHIADAMQRTLAWFDTYLK